MTEAQFYKKLPENRVQCLLCNHYCVIANGTRGLCGVRENQKGTLYSLVYSKVIAAHVDPIEKKPLFHFQPGSTSFSIATVGCNFRCLHCQNADISQASKDLNYVSFLPRIAVWGKLHPVRNIISNGVQRESSKIIEKVDSRRRGNDRSKEIPGAKMTPAQVIAKALANHCQSIAYTYTEPTIFAEFALDCMKLAKEKRIKNIWVTNGYTSPIALKTIKPYLAAANVDLKFFTEKNYQKICGAKLQPVLDNLIWYKKNKIWLEITTLIIPTLNDSKIELKQIAEFIKKELGKNTPWHVTAFFPTYKLTKLPATPNSTIKKAWQIGKAAGLKYVYGGNVIDQNLENTYCPKCEELIIERRGYDIKRFDKIGGCPKCGEKLDIIE